MCPHLPCRWQSSFAAAGRKRSAPTITDPYIRLILDRCLPGDVENRLCQEPLDRLMQDVIAVRTAVIDETLLEWTKGTDGISQVVLIASGYDTRSWRLRWASGVSVFEVDSAMIQSQVCVGRHGSVVIGLDGSAWRLILGWLAAALFTLPSLSFSPSLLVWSAEDDCPGGHRAAVQQAGSHR
jgi:hypothetical protein